MKNFGHEGYLSENLGLNLCSNMGKHRRQLFLEFLVGEVKKEESKNRERKGGGSFLYSVTLYRG